MEGLSIHLGAQYCAKCACWKTSETDKDVGTCANEDSPNAGKVMWFVDGCTNWKPRQD